MQDQKRMKDFCITFELEQQTPIIHFQHDQEGATLRATEVKPKLDRFIIKKMGGIDKIKDWRIKDTNALNYKMKIQASGDGEVSKSGDLMIEGFKTNDKDLKKESRNAINKMYFGNMVSEKDSSNSIKAPDDFSREVKEQFKETVFFDHKTPIKLTIICFIPKLLNEIKNNIHEFFFVENFGCRQSKGFGGFKVVNPIQQANSDCIELLKNRGYLFFWTEVKEGSFSELLNHAMTIYAVLKSGINMTRWDDKQQRYLKPKAYIKGYIQRDYLDLWEKDKRIGSDKALIKKHKKIRDGESWPQKRKIGDEYVRYDDYVFIRAILGLADHYEFRDLRKGNVYVYSLNEKEDSFDISRFKSPITVKIIDKKIIFIFNPDAMQNILGKEFYILTKNVPENKKSVEEKCLYIKENGHIIKTPDKFSIDIKTLITGYVDYFNRKKSVLMEFDHPYKKSANITLKGEV